MTRDQKRLLGQWFKHYESIRRNWLTVQDVADAVWRRRLLNNIMVQRQRLHRDRKQIELGISGISRQVEPTILVVEARNVDALGPEAEAVIKLLTERLALRMPSFGMNAEFKLYREPLDDGCVAIKARVKNLQSPRELHFAQKEPAAQSTETLPGPRLVPRSGTNS